jgi:hypothetical protein
MYSYTYIESYITHRPSNKRQLNLDSCLTCRAPELQTITCRILYYIRAPVLLTITGRILSDYRAPKLHTLSPKQGRFTSNFWECIWEQVPWCVILKCNLTSSQAKVGGTTPTQLFCPFPGQGQPWRSTASITPPP